MKLLFFDHSLENIDEYRKTLPVNTESVIEYDFVIGDIRKIVNEHDIQILVSPANSCGFMNEGIDAVYMELFPGIENKVKERIAKCAITQTERGMKTLPVGSAILVPTGDPVIKLLACVPTMMMPSNIVGTYNVYWAMRGLLRLLQPVADQTSITVAIPPFGTGVGSMSSQESAQQIASAIDDHLRGNVAVCDPNCDAHIVDTICKWAYVLSDHAVPNKEKQTQSKEI